VASSYFVARFDTAACLRRVNRFRLTARRAFRSGVASGSGSACHALLDLRDQRQLESHPKVGASWEGFVIEQICVQLDVRPEDAFFWGTHAGPELDLLIHRRGRLHGFEIKRTVAPRVTESMNRAREVLDLASLSIVHAGKASFELRDGVKAIAASRILDDL
jgi:predicted AAA+ superfamily ATPase